MKKFVTWPIIILFILCENPYLDLGLAMLAITFLIYEKDLLGISHLKKHNLDNEELDKNKSYEKIEALYKQKENSKNNYKMIENLQTEIIKDEKKREPHHIIQKQLIYLKLFCVYLFYSYFLVYVNNFNDICYYMPEIIALFSPLILIGIFLKSKHQTLRAKMIILLMAFVPMIFTGLSYYLSITKPKNYEYIQNYFLVITGVIFLIIFINLLKFLIKNRT